MEDELSTFHVDPRSGVGIAEQIFARIALQIADGEFAPGDRLPSIRSLASDLGVNGNTIRAAYSKLEADGLVATRQGIGSVVRATTTGAPPSRALPLGVNTIAVLIAGLDPFYLPMLRGIEAVASERATLVLITDSHDSPSLADTLTRRLVARGVDGIIAVSVGRRPDFESGNRAAGLPPIVHVDQPDRRGYSLLFDGIGAGYAATRHLSKHGHKRIGIVTAPPTWPNAGEVYRGYLNALEDAPGGSSPALVSEAPEFSVEAGRHATARLLELPDPPTAVFAASSPFALGALYEAKSRGLQVPHDLAIVGYTDSPLSALVDPPLTMVEVPASEIGVLAMRTLFDLIDGKRPRPRRTILRTRLVVRHSCGSHDAGTSHDPADI